MVMVRIVRIRAKVSVTVSVSVNRVTIRMGTENSSCRVYFFVRPGRKITPSVVCRAHAAI